MTRSRSFSARYAASSCPAVSFTPSVCAICGRTSSGSVIAASVTKNTPCGKSSTSSAAAWSASRVFPVPPGPVSVTARTSDRRRSSTTSATSRSRPTSGVGCTGRFVGRFSKRPERREPLGETLEHQLEQALRLGQVLQPVLAEVREGEPRVVVGDQVVRGVGYQHLPAVSRRADPRPSMDPDPHVALRGGGRLCRVDPHPDPELAAVRPCVVRQGALAVARCDDRVARAGEADEEGVTLRVDLVPLERGEGLAQEPSVIVEHGGVRLGAEVSKQPRRALDIGEQEGDGPGGALAHRRMMPRRPCPKLRLAPAGSAPVGHSSSRAQRRSSHRRCPEAPASWRSFRPQRNAAGCRRLRGRSRFAACSSRVVEGPAPDTRPSEPRVMNRNYDSHEDRVSRQLTQESMDRRVGGPSVEGEEAVVHMTGWVGGRVGARVSVTVCVASAMGVLRRRHVEATDFPVGPP